MIEDDSREHVYLPWHFRDRVIPSRTYSGRVVYERPKHFFGISDLERIANKIKLDQKTPPNKLERLFRAIWALAAPAWAPFYKDHFNTIFDYLVWSIRNITDIISDPQGALKRRTLELIYALADLIGVDITFKEG